MVWRAMGHTQILGSLRSQKSGEQGRRLHALLDQVESMARARLRWGQAIVP
jgi:hypothetical protein